mmetsp:Transcript_5078/g.5786  ORF Transcript_5078/g.5786 Transcript_5078/m.5786 type:complete len:177 (-) Transcript_5078:56-586(-)|eukprot:TRINITY_DN1999_c0_g1_i2.p2 TRINITY_DN1999_c0_g1~~TRINITY_DN1999_c0_g1_i2.p2  ORF type:complete len:177 (+),score=16.74 TRINITY_DN1999_c0_g1_i2:85-615(+)
MEKCYCDWGEHGGDWCMCLQFFSGNMECCEPCCGQPCNSSDGVYCCLSWFPCCCLAAPKCYAASQNQECAVINHCVPFLGLLLSIIPIIGGILSFAVYCAIRTAIRFNLRKQHGIGQDECDLCDCCGIWFYVPAPCFSCQELRSVPKESWDWYAAMQAKKFPAETKIEPMIWCCVD